MGELLNLRGRGDECRPASEARSRVLDSGGCRQGLNFAPMHRRNGRHYLSSEVDFLAVSVEPSIGVAWRVPGPRMVADLLRICQTWRPDLFVRDTQAYGGCIAAEMLGIPHAANEAMLTALAHGIPQVMVPIAADQPENAELCAAAGVARVVPPHDATASSICRSAGRAHHDWSSGRKSASGQRWKQIAVCPVMDLNLRRRQQVSGWRTRLTPCLGAGARPQAW